MHEPKPADVCVPGRLRLRGLFEKSLQGLVGLLILVLATGVVAARVQAATAEGPAHASADRAVSHQFVVEKGDTLYGILRRAGLPADDIRSIVRTCRSWFDPRRLRVGNEVTLTLSDDPQPRLLALHFDLGRNMDFTLVARGDGTFRRAGAVKGSPGGERSVQSVSGVVGKHFEASLEAAGVPSTVAREARRILAFDTDLPASPAAGTAFQVLFDGDAGQAAQNDGLLGIALKIDGRKHHLYRYHLADGLVAFVGPDGRGVLQAHLASPVPGAQVSSPWGWRIHPVLKRPIFHRGIDLRAPAGTPVLAAADGRVIFVGRHGNYGRLVKIKHTANLTTAYAHLQNYRKGLRVGAQVRKGEVIGYVGRSGLATGNHLYFEVFADGKRVNPAQTPVTVPIQLSSKSLVRLRDTVSEEKRAEN